MFSIFSQIQMIIIKMNSKSALSSNCVQKIDLVIDEAITYQRESIVHELRSYRRIAPAESIDGWTRERLKNLLRYVINNTFIDQGGALFRQTVGIPMGTNAVPLIANLYLYFYESRFVDDLRDDVSKNGFRYAFRFIDDLLVVNSTNITECTRRMYPPSLTLTQTTCEDSDIPFPHAHFLGIDIVATDVGRDLFRMNIFDKRDQFPFIVNRYPKKDSCIPSSIIRGVVIGQVKRYAMICSDNDSFNDECRKLFERMTHNGWSRRMVLSALRAGGSMIV